MAEEKTSERSSKTTNSLMSSSSSSSTLNYNVINSSSINEQIVKDNHGNRVYVFKDDEHQNSLLENLNMLRKNRQFCDVILQVGSNQDIHEIYAHKVVLSSSSPYLLEMFSNESTMVMMANNQLHHHHNHHPQQYRLVSSTSGGKNTNSVEFDPEAFDHIIDYAYTAELKVPMNKVREIYAIASRLKMSNVAYKCGQVLLSTLNTENCLEVRNMKTVLKDPYLLQSVDGYIRQNFETIVSSSSFQSQLSQIKIDFLLNSEQEENCINDRHMFNEILDWLRRSHEKDQIDLDVLKNNESNVNIGQHANMQQHMLMLFYNRDRNEIQDCSQLESNSPEESEIIEDYKKLNKKNTNTLIKSLSNDNLSNVQQNGKFNNNNNINSKPTLPSKPRQFLFTRSDSESSLSSVADDDDGQEWKVLATCKIGNHTLVGLVSILGQLFLLSITLRIKEIGQNSFNNSKESDGDCEFVFIPPMSSPRCAVGTAEFDGKLFVCGGYDRGECLKTVEVYDSVENKWKLLPPMQVPRGRFAVAVVNEHVYAIGGCDGQNELNSAEFYDGHEWKLIQSAPVARSNAGVCSMNSRIYMIGGWNGNRGMTRCDVYNTQTDQWAEIAPLNTGRYQMGACLHQDTIYAVGGCDSWSCLNSVEAYVNDSWRLVEPLQTARRGCGVASYNGKIYVVGGHDGIHALCSVEIYDPTQNEWTFGKPMTTARANVGVVVVQNRLYAVGGFNGKTFLNTIEYFDFKLDQWTTSIPLLNTDPSIIKTISSSLNKENLVENYSTISSTKNSPQKTTNNDHHQKEDNSGGKTPRGSPFHRHHQNGSQSLPQNDNYEAVNCKNNFMNNTSANGSTKTMKNLSPSSLVGSEPLVEVEETIVGH